MIDPAYNLLLIVITLAITILIFYHVFQSTDRSKTLDRHMKIQTQLLALMAQKSEVPNEKINKVLATK